MPRPHKPRWVDDSPQHCIFKPAGIPVRELEWIELTVDEYEALRLVDLEGMQQEAAAEQLGVSRPTISRILARGRGKLARMIAQGCALVIQGGSVSFREEEHRGRHGHGRHHGRRR